LSFKGSNKSNVDRFLHERDDAEEGADRERIRDIGGRFTGEFEG
jgi:hypothetical protein